MGFYLEYAFYKYMYTLYMLSKDETNLISSLVFAFCILVYIYIKYLWVNFIRK